MSLALLIPLVCLGVFLLAFLGIGLYAVLTNFLRIRDRNRRPHALLPYIGQLDDMDAQLQQMGLEEHSCVSDGFRLHGAFLDQHSKKVAVLVHGISNQGKSRYLDAQFYLDRGYSLFFPDLRGCGQSEGHWYGMGQYERRDLLRWTELIRARVGEDCQIVLDGVSMGSASVLMLAGDKQAQNIAAVIADCGYTSAKAEICHCLKGMKLPVGIVYLSTRLWIRLLAGYDLNDAAPIDVIRNADAPILFIHGEDDHFVPCSMSRELFDACQSEKAIFTVPGAAHAAARVTDRLGCEQAMDDFLSRYIQ